MTGHLQWQLFWLAVQLAAFLFMLRLDRRLNRQLKRMRYLRREVDSGLEALQASAEVYAELAAWRIVGAEHGFAVSKSTETGLPVSTAKH